MKKISLIKILIAISVSLPIRFWSFCQTIPAKAYKIETWHSYPVPNDSSTLSKYGWDNSEWTVWGASDSVWVINTFHPSDREQVPFDSIPKSVSDALWKYEKVQFRKSKAILKVDDGYLIGINHGEFGGHIVWYSNDGKKHYTISSEQVIQFIRKDNDIFAIQGLAHLGISEGSIIRLSKWKKRWNSSTFHTLPYAPVGIGINSKNHFVIATSNSLLEINDDEKYLTLIDNAFWDLYGYLYPTSLVVRNDVIFIGMRGGVFKFDLKSKRQEWLMIN